MIARVPQPAHSLLLSARLGLVSVPAVPEFLPQDEAFDPAQARDLLRSLGRTLGLTLLERREGVFPETDAEGMAGETVGLDEAVVKTLEGLDAVWLKDGEVVAAFTVEARPGVHAGLRRLADALALHPKLKAPLYAVTVPALEAGLLAEVHRPVNRLLKKPLTDLLRVLDWDRLRGEVEQLGERVRYLKPEFLEGISEPVAPPAGA